MEAPRDRGNDFVTKSISISFGCYNSQAYSVIVLSSISIYRTAIRSVVRSCYSEWLLPRLDLSRYIAYSKVTLRYCRSTLAAAKTSLNIVVVNSYRLSSSRCRTWISLRASKLLYTLK